MGGRVDGDERKNIEGAKPRPARAPLDELARLAPRLAAVVESCSKRRDVRTARSRILVVLLEARCPRNVAPRRPWYVPGAVARMPIAVQRQAFRQRWGEEPPSERRWRDHLRELERALAIVRAPGDPIPQLRPNPSGEPRAWRYPDTVHLLDDDADAEWWAAQGAFLVAQHPEVRVSAAAWRLHLGDWRERRPVQLELFALLDRVAARMDVRGNGPPPVRSLDDGRAAAVLAAVATGEGPARDALERMAAAGVEVRGRMRPILLARPERLRGAAGLLALALRRQRPVRNRTGFIVSVWRSARDAELSAARAALETRSGESVA